MRKIFILVLAFGLIGSTGLAFAQQGGYSGTQGPRGMGTPGIQGIDPSPGMQGSMVQPMQISHLIGKKIVGSGGETLGTIRDLVIDPQGRVQFAVVAVSEGKTVAVPFEALSPARDGQSFALNATRDQLANAPEFNRNVVLDRSYSDRVYRYFGVQPRWSDQYQMEAPATGGQGTRNAPPQSLHNQAQEYQGSGTPGEQGLSGQDRRR